MEMFPHNSTDKGFIPKIKVLVLINKKIKIQQNMGKNKEQKLLHKRHTDKQ